VSLITVKFQQLSDGQVYCLFVVANGTTTATVHSAKFFLVLCCEYYSMDGYPFNELANIHLVHGNGQRAVHLCQEMFSNRCQSSHKTFAAIDCQLLATGVFKPLSVTQGKEIKLDI
jgi:hypothetical protein